MDSLKKFETSRVVKNSDLIIAIGEIDNQKAIYLVPSIKITDKQLNQIVLEKNNELAKVVKKPISTTQLENFVMKMPIHSRLIYPATKKHLRKYFSEYIYRTESYDEYQHNCENLKSTWIDDIANGKSQGEKIYSDSEEYLIIDDYKWNESYGVDNLYMLVVFKDARLRSVRDINETSDIDLLKKCKVDVLSVLEKFTLLEENVLLFFHYRPSYFRLHLHVVNISNNAKFVGSQARNILLDDVIRNIKIDGNFYKKDMYFYTNEK